MFITKDDAETACVPVLQRYPVRSVEEEMHQGKLSLFPTNTGELTVLSSLGMLKRRDGESNCSQTPCTKLQPDATFSGHQVLHSDNTLPLLYPKAHLLKKIPAESLKC